MPNVNQGLTVSGDVSAFEAAVEIINLIANAQQSGCLVFSPEDGRRYLCFDKGEIIGAGSDRLLEGFGVFTLQRGLSREDLHRVGNEQQHLKKTLVEIFVNRKILTLQQFQDLYDNYTKEIIYTCLLIRKGSFQLINFDPNMLPLRSNLNLQAILMEGLCRLDEYKHFSSQVPDRFTRLGKKTNEKPALLTKNQDLLWNALTRPNYVEALARKCHLGEFDIIKAAFQLIEKNKIEVLPESEEESSARSLSESLQNPEPLQYLFDVEKLNIKKTGNASIKGKICPHCLRLFQLDIKRCPHDNKNLVLDRTGQQILDRYEFVRLLGVGGMGGTVWEARQLTTERAVAIKLFPPSSDEEENARFARGARLASHLNHPHITTVHDYGLDQNGNLFLVMELLKGVSLSTRLKEVGSMPIDRALRITNQILRALESAHEHRAVHRDLKPDNLFLITQNGYLDYIKVNDFGIAKYEEEEQTENSGVTTARKICGTPKYMAPEQIVSGKIDARTDLYSLGVVLFRMITGRLPFVEKDTYTLFRQIITQPAPRMSDVREDLSFPEQLEQFVARSLQKDAKHRFNSAREMRSALYAVRMSLGFVDDEESHAYSMAQSHVMSQILEQSVAQNALLGIEKSKKNNLITIAVIFTVLTSLVSILIFMLMGRETNKQPDIRRNPTLFLSSDPSGAIVKIENAIMGKTPVELKMPIGKYEFELVLSGYETTKIKAEFDEDGLDFKQNVILREMIEKFDLDGSVPIKIENEKLQEEIDKLRNKEEQRRKADERAEERAKRRAEEREKRQNEERERQIKEEKMSNKSNKEENKKQNKPTVISRPKVDLVEEDKNRPLINIID